MSRKIVSVDFKAMMGSLRKPEVNDGIYLTFNILHKPALLGIFGAIVGLGGYSQSFDANMLEESSEAGKQKKTKDKNSFIPQFYTLFSNLKIGIQPIRNAFALGNGKENEERPEGYQKILIKYNNSTGYASHDYAILKEKIPFGMNLIIMEQVLLYPAYRVYILLDLDIELHQDLYNHLKNQTAEFIPYLGKNEFQLWWNNFKEYENFEENYKPYQHFRIHSIFLKTDNLVVKNLIEEQDIESDEEIPSYFIFFEEIPVAIDFDTKKMYEYQKIVYTNSLFKADTRIDNLYLLKPQNLLVQLF